MPMKVDDSPIVDGNPYQPGSGLKFFGWVEAHLLCHFLNGKAGHERCMKWGRCLDRNG